MKRGKCRKATKGARSVGRVARRAKRNRHTDKAYARIDGGAENPGYFTDIADKP